MPKADDLPETIRKLHYRNGIHVRDFASIDEELLPSLKVLAELVMTEAFHGKDLLDEGPDGFCRICWGVWMMLQSSGNGKRRSDAARAPFLAGTSPNA